MREETPFRIDPFQPAYLRLLRSGELERRAREAREELRACRLCPRECGADRLAGKTGVCRTAARAVVSSAFPHFGEESVLVGRGGSGTIFFSWCNLRCVFCQNAEISQRGEGEPVASDRIAGLMLRLQSAGCANINLVSPSHVVPQAIEAVAIAAREGLRLPIVYNSNAYDSIVALRLLEGIVDIYMPDFKFWERASARRFSKAADYPDRAREAIREMHRQVGPLAMGSDGAARRGLLVRHLVMPGLEAESRAILRWLAEEISPDTYVNIMDQYRPCHRVGERLPRSGRRYETIDRRPSREEIASAFSAARESGLWRFDR